VNEVSVALAAAIVEIPNRKHVGC